MNYPYMSPQATFTPVGCNITIASLCTPVCGQAAGLPQMPVHGTMATVCTQVACHTHFLGCPPTHACPPTHLTCPPTVAFTCVLGATPQTEAQPQATFTPVGCNITIASLCTPVCGNAAAVPQAPAPLFSPIGICTHPPHCVPHTAMPGCLHHTLPPVCLPPIHTLIGCPQPTPTAQPTFVCPQTVTTTVQPTFACPQAEGIPQGGVQAQGTFTPLGCGGGNISIASLCTPLCGGVPTLSPAHCLHTLSPACIVPTHSPFCPMPVQTIAGCFHPTTTVQPTFACGVTGGVPQGGVQAQATFTPIGCGGGVTVASLCTPVCGGGHGVTVATLCTPVCGGAPGHTVVTPVCGGGHGVTVATLCTPICLQAAGVPQNDAVNAAAVTGWPTARTMCFICPPIGGTGPHSPISLCHICPMAAGVPQNDAMNAAAVTGWPTPRTMCFICPPVGGTGPHSPISLCHICPMAAGVPQNAGVEAAALGGRTIMATMCFCPPVTGFGGCVPHTIHCPMAVPQGVGGMPQTSPPTHPNSPCCFQGAAAAPQATVTPVGCNITIFSICTPLCGG